MWKTKASGAGRAVRRTLGVASLLTGMALTGMAGAVPATAHTALEASTPEDGARLDAPPEQIVLDFTESVRTRLSRVSVRGPGGEQFEQGATQSAADKVTQPVRPLGAAGEYEIVFRVVAADGHPLTGTVRFTMSRPGPGAAAAPSAGQQPPGAAIPDNAADSAADDGGVPWVFLGVVGFAVAAFVVGGIAFVRQLSRDSG